MPDLHGYNVRIVGVSWYSEETWRELAAIPEATIKKTYPQYVRNSERLIDWYGAQGFEVDKVAVDVGQMVARCHRHGY